MDAIGNLVAAHLPGHPTGPVRRLGAGTDNAAYEVNGELVVRFNRSADGPQAVTREARLLATVAEISPLAVPQPAFTVPEQGALAYRKLPGRPALELAEPWRVDHRERIGAALGDLLAALHAAPPDRFAGLAEPDHTPPLAWREEAAGHYRAVAADVPDRYRAAVERFLAADPPDGADRLRFSHNDLGIEHVLVDETDGTVTGIIDWTDAAITDPAYDFGLLYRDLGPVALAAALARYPGRDPALRRRAAYYARCAALEDLAYGRETGESAYVDKSRAGFAWLFG